MPKIVHYHLTVGETVSLPAGSRVLSHKTDYSQGTPRVSLVVEEPGEKPEHPLAALAEQWAEEDRKRYAAIDKEREKERAFAEGERWPEQMVVKPRSCGKTDALDAFGLLFASPIARQLHQHHKRAARDAILFGTGWVGFKPQDVIYPQPSPLEAAAKRVRQTTDAFAKASKAAAAAEDASHRATAYRDECQKAMAHAQEDLTALALKAA